MSESALLSSAAVQWMRIEDRPHRVINSIHRQLTAFEGSSREMFRENIVLDATANSHVPHSYQRLVRLTEDAPHDVFQRGFLPLYTDEDLANDTAFNLEEVHLASRDEPRIFVSTTRPSRVDGRLHVWKPQTFAETVFEYEVYACGGIDVNRVIPDNQFLAEQEIAFPGGIRCESIRLASERRYGELIAVLGGATSTYASIAETNRLNVHCAHQVRHLRRGAGETNHPKSLFNVRPFVRIGPRGTLG